MYIFLDMISKNLEINILAYEYVGYGINKKGEATKEKPSEKNCLNSIEGAILFLIHKKEVKVEDIIIFGTSLGSGPSIYIAQKYALDKKHFYGMILQSPFTSIIKTKFSLVGLGYMDMFPNLDRISDIECPVFLIHGKKDEVVPYDHSLELYRKLKYPYSPLYVENAGHNDIMEKCTPHEYLISVFSFISFLQKKKRKSYRKRKKIILTKMKMKK